MSGGTESASTVPGTGPDVASPPEAGAVEIEDDVEDDAGAPAETEETTGDGRDPADIPRGEIFELLSNDRRRYVLRYFRRTDQAVDLSSLVRQVAAWEQEVSAEEVTRDERKRVYTSLRQTHLPKMEAAGFVTFDAENGTVEPSEDVSDLDIYMEIVPGRELAWREYYLGLGLVSAALVAAVWAGVYPFTLLPDIAWAAVIAGAIVVSALANLYHEHTVTFDEL